MGSEIWKPNHWNPDKWLPFCQKPFEIRTNMSGFWMVRFSNGWDYTYGHSQTIWKPDHLKSNLQNVWISNAFGFQMVGFQIPTVFMLLSDMIWRFVQNELTYLSYFQPVHIRELVELLQEIGCVRIQTLVRRGKPGYYFYLIWSTQIQLKLTPRRA